MSLTVLSHKKHPEKLHLSHFDLLTSSPYLIYYFFATFLTVLVTTRGNLGEAKHLTVNTVSQEQDHGAFSQQHNKEIKGCLKQRYTCSWSLNIAARGEAEVVERGGRVRIVRAVCGGNFTVSSGRPSDNPPGKARDDKAVRGTTHIHTHSHINATLHRRIHMWWKTGQGPVTISETKGKSAGSGHTPTQLFPTQAHQHSQQ